MSLVVNHNMMAANVARNLNAHYSRLSTSTQRLSTGMRVNSAADDAAGLAIRELQRADIAALHQGARNANDAISMIQVADGAMGVIDEKLIRMKELAEQAATGTYNSTQRLMIESEYQQMASEITRIANATDFNGVKLLDGTLAGIHDGSGLDARGAMKIHFGTGNDSAEDYYYIEIGNCTAWALGVGNELLDPRFARVRENVTLQEMMDAARRGGTEAIYEATFAEAKAEAKDRLEALRQLAPPHRPVDLTDGMIDRLSDDEARAKAEKAAERDGEAVSSLVRGIRDDAYLKAYNTAFLNATAAGRPEAEAMAFAETEAEKAALAAVKDRLMDVASTGSAAGVAGYVPPKTEESFNALLDAMVDAAKEHIYRSIIDDPALFDAVLAQAVAGLPAGSAPLTQEEMDEIYEQVRQQVRGKVDGVGNDILDNLNTLVAVDNLIFHDPAAPAHTGWMALYHTELTAFNMAHPAQADTELAHVVARQRAYDEGVRLLQNLPEADFFKPRDKNTGNIDQTPGNALLQDNDVRMLAGAFQNFDFYTTIERQDGGNPPVLIRTQIPVNMAAVQANPTGTAAAVAAEMAAVRAAYLADPKTKELVSDAAVVKAAQKVLDELTEYPAGATVSTQEQAQRAIEAINEAIVSKDKIRAHLGALQNRLENTITNLNVQAENMQASESRISDVDVATEMTEFTRNQILTQSAVAMLAQANSLPQMALQLLGG